jgi:uncharacterized hydantoinase/oxoprolinase family protein
LLATLKQKNNLTAESLRLVKMKRYIINQRVFIIELYLKNNETLKAAVRKFDAKYGINSVLTSSIGKRLIEQAVQMSISKQCMRVLVKFRNTNTKHSS